MTGIGVPPLRLRRRIAVPLAVLALLAAAAPATALLPRGSVRFVEVQSVTLPIALAAPTASPAAPSEAGLRVARLTSPEPDTGSGPPVDIDSGLLERTPVGDVPRIGSDGRTPLDHYARPASGGCRRPCAAVLVAGLGLADRLTARALSLPGPVGLSFSPYADAAAWQARARAAGHEALLTLPVQPERFPIDDAGPLAISAAAPESAILRVLAAGSGYVALDVVPGAYASAPASFALVAELLAARGLGLIEIGGEVLAASAHAAGLAYLGRATPVDLEPTPAAIDAALAALAEEALAGRRPLAVAQPLPASFDRLAAWMATLPERGIELVPPSLLLRDAAAAPVATRD